MHQISFLYPTEGAILLSGADGTECGGSLQIQVRVKADPASELTINGVLAAREADAFTAQVSLASGFNEIIAQTSQGEQQKVRVWWLKGAERTVHMTIDDCIRCFEDLTRSPEQYPSLFDHPYLAIFHEAHMRFGSKVHINVFYESVDGTFNLSMMTDRYKEEFRANADWLSLSFHAIREFPDEIYRNASYEEVLKDCQMVTSEIIRFAGKEVLRESTTLHWGAATADGVRALRKEGFHFICGYLQLREDGTPFVSYHLNADQVKEAGCREGYVDFDEDVFIFKLDLMLDQIPSEQVRPYLEELSKRPHESQMLMSVIHEQYFYEDYINYEPDYKERVLHMAGWASEHGYVPISLTETVKKTFDK